MNEPRQPADVVLTGSRIYTVNPNQPWADALAIVGDRIAAVGSRQDIGPFIGPGTRVADLGGRMVLPGFVSGHDHLIASDWMSYGVQLYDARSREEYHDLIRDYAEQNPDDAVIKGIGWNPAIYGGMPTFEELDILVPDRPAILLEFTIHDAWLNSRALEIGGITSDTPDPLPGVTYWNRDSDGNPTGTGIEFAWMPTYVATGAWDPAAMIPSSIERNFSAAAASGLTTFLNPGLVTPNVNTPEGMFEDLAVTMRLLEGMADVGKLDLRTFVQPLYKNPEANPLEFVERSLELSRRFDSDQLRCFGIKIHPEGNWTSRTSLMLEPYEGTTTAGAAGVKADRLEQVIVAANDKELDVVVHSDGSATIRATIDAIAASIKRGNTSSRNALHHLFWTHPGDLDRILEMNIAVNVTPLFSTDWTGQDLLARQRLGEARTAEQFAAYPKIVANGNRVSLSADVPSSPLEHVSPLFNMQTAMTLRDPSNADSVAFPPGRSGIALDAAIRAVTIDAAWQIRMEDRIGSIEPGKYADLVILDDNLFDVDPSAIADVAVYETIMGGRTTYSGR